MNQPKITLRDLASYGDLGFSKYTAPSRFLWDRSDTVNPISVFSDSCFELVNSKIYKDVKKIALMVEPPCIRTDSYQYISQNYGKFDMVFCHLEDFAKQIPNGKWFPNLEYWVKKEDWAIYNKSQDICCIFSEKNWAPGHQLRRQIVNVFGQNINVFGRGYKPVDHKIQLLGPHRFEIVVENCQDNGYFSEKIWNPFVTGTIPIYWGSKTIEKFFNPNGILYFNDMNELNNIIKYIKQDPQKAYEEKLEFIKENYDRALKLPNCSEDWLWDHYFKDTI